MMKKILFTCMALAITSLGFISCDSNNDTKKPTETTDYYSIALGNFGASTAGEPILLKANILAAYMQAFVNMGATATGTSTFTTTLTQQDVQKACVNNAEPAAQTLINDSNYPGSISVTIRHYTGDTHNDFYNKDFEKEDKTLYSVAQSMAIIDSLCVGMNKTDLTSYHSAFDKEVQKQVVGSKNVTNLFKNTKDSLATAVKNHSTIAQNKSIVLKIQQTVTDYTDLNKTSFIIVSCDSTNTNAKSPAGVKNVFRVVYHYATEYSGRCELWSNYYLTDSCILAFSTKDGVMKYALKDDIFDPIEADTFLVRKMKALEPGAETWLNTNAPGWSPYTISTSRISFFGNKNNVYSKTFKRPN